jgi:hypothetical protein
MSVRAESCSVAAPSHPAAARQAASVDAAAMERTNGIWRMDVSVDVESDIVLGAEAGGKSVLPRRIAAPPVSSSHLYGERGRRFPITDG